MKRWLTLLVVMALVFAVIGCGETEVTPPATGDNGEEEPEEALDFKVGMVTDMGTIDDKSFNQGTWEGVLLAASDFGLETRYLQPGGTTPADYLTEIGNLADAGFDMIVCPGFKFEPAIYEAQTKYPEVKFVLIDGEPKDENDNPVIEDNVVGIYFAEHESGFLAGVATALQLKEGEVGFIGGMEIPPVQKYSWGFQQGVNYANDNYDTNIVMKVENFIYQGTFDDVAAGQVLAAAMYDKGVDAIFAAAGAVGVGAINEAKTRAAAGEEVWVVGVDMDQYDDGIYEGSSSIILTSAMKYIDVATYDMIKYALEGNFPGGQALVLDATNAGIGIPRENPNLDSEVEELVAEVFAALEAGEFAVADAQGELFK